MLFEPFVWMFKYKLFKKHYLYLFLFTLICLFMAFIIPYLLVKFINIFGIQYYITILSVVLVLIPLLILQGYFWELTEAFIERDIDIKSANIYNGRIKEIFIIEFPEIRAFKLIWRGIASIVATFLLSLPFWFMIYSGNVTKLTLVNQLICYVFWCLFVPALLWNYAHRDSVVAVWNLRKAIYLMGNYPFRYVWKILLIVANFAVDYYALTYLIKIFGLFSPEMSVVYILKLASVILLATIKYLYDIYVCAYLLGTLAPVDEH